MSEPTPPGRGYIAVDLGDGTAWVQRPEPDVASAAPLASWERAILHQARELDAARARLNTALAMPALVSGVLCDAWNIPVSETDDLEGLHTGLRKLLSQRDAASARLAAALAVLRDVEWDFSATDSIGDPRPSCPACYASLESGHRPDCPLARVLAPEGP